MKCRGLVRSNLQGVIWFCVVAFGCQSAVLAKDRSRPSNRGQPAELDPSQDLIILTARGLENFGEPDSIQQALKVYNEYLESGVTGKSRREAAFGAGRCEARLGRLWKAFTTVEKSFPPRLEAKIVAKRIKLEYKIAQELMAMKMAVVPDAVAGGKKLNGFEAASRVFAAVVYNDPQSTEAPQALLNQGDCLTVMREYKQAETAYRKLIIHYAKASKTLEARAALARVLWEKPYRNAMPRSAREEAEELLQAGEVADSQTPALKRRLTLAKQARQESRAAELLQKGVFHRRRKTARDRQSAEFFFREVLRLYPHLEAAKKARDELLKLGLETEEKEK